MTRPAPSIEFYAQIVAGARTSLQSAARRASLWVMGNIGRFIVDERPQPGGMSVVFRGFDPERNCPVAIKVLVQTSVGDEDEATLESRARRNTLRFVREADLLASLRHDAIVSYLERGVDAAGSPFIVMEWLEGTTLLKAIAPEPLSIDDTFIVAERIASALAYTHSLGILHRDIKPGNVLLVGGDIQRATLLDFGLARQGASHLTREGSVLGTPGYMSPEQARGTEQVDARTDIFSLACLLYRCLTGMLPFSGRDMYTRMRSVLMEDPVDVVTLRSDTPPALAILIRQMLQKDPALRPPDGQAIVDALARIQAPRSETGPVLPGLVTLSLFSPGLGDEGPTLVDSQSLAQRGAEVHWKGNGFVIQYRHPHSLRDRVIIATDAAKALLWRAPDAHIFISAAPFEESTPPAPMPQAEPGIRLDQLATQLVIDSEVELSEDSLGARVVVFSDRGAL